MDSGLSLREPRNDETNLVIPEAAARGCPESILTMAVMDSGPAPDGASRNDEKAGFLQEPRNDETNAVILGHE